jgi:diguanylate cyclase (GGDEF)-like protein
VIPQILQAKVAVFVEMAKKNMQLRIKTEELARLNQDLRVQRLQDLERINAELEQEIKERKQAEQRAHELSTRDALTNLLNRRALIQQLEHAVATSDRSGVGFALLFLDLDKFKPINDTYGHEAGDELLRQVAARLTAAVRVADIVARLGGDEFVVLIEGKSASANAARVAARSSRLRPALRHRRPPREDGGQHRHRPVSAGRRQRPGADEERRHRHVPRQAKQRHAGAVLPRRAQCARARTRTVDAGTAQGARFRPAGTALRTAGRSRAPAA